MLGHAGRDGRRMLYEPAHNHAILQCPLFGMCEYLQRLIRPSDWSGAAARSCGRALSRGTLRVRVAFMRRMQVVAEAGRMLRLTWPLVAWQLVGEWPRSWARRIPGEARKFRTLAQVRACLGDDCKTVDVCLPWFESRTCHETAGQLGASTELTPFGSGPQHRWQCHSACRGPDRGRPAPGRWRAWTTGRLAPENARRRSPGRSGPAFGGGHDTSARPAILAAAAAPSLRR